MEEQLSGEDVGKAVPACKTQPFNLVFQIGEVVSEGVFRFRKHNLGSEGDNCHRFAHWVQS